MQVLSAMVADTSVNITQITLLRQYLLTCLSQHPSQATKKMKVSSSYICRVNRYFAAVSLRLILLCDVLCNP